MSGYSTIADCLDHHSSIAPQRLAYRFLPDSDDSIIELNYGELRARVLAIAGALQSRIPPGQRVLLLLPSGIEFIEMFLACLYAGVIAVPLYPPRPNQNFGRLATVRAGAAPALAIATAAQLPGLVARCDADLAAAPLAWASVEELRGAAAPFRAAPPTPDDIAFIQYTSGSTAAPKGVVLTHRNIMHNQAQIQRAFRHDTTDHVMGWLPVFHDMGLIGNILQPLYLGIGCTLMSHLSFLQRPVRWLQAISTYRATTSGGPNFAFQLCVQRVSEAQKDGLDLSHWRLAFCGAEVVRPETVRQFAEAFAPCGFDATAFYPCYGLAEATLFVAGAATRRAPQVRSWSASALTRGEAVAAPHTDDDRPLIACGSAIDADLRIVDPETMQALPSGHVGEIWVCGDSVAAGYWRNDTLTIETFRARTASSPGDGPYLRTGDLGFVDADGELFVTGRLKDLIIIRGRNHVPTDIEATVEQVNPSFRQGGCAAFAIDIAGREQLVVAQEIEREHRQRADLASALDAVREQVTRVHGISVHDLVLIRHGALPRTSSGKIQRHLCAQRYIDGTLNDAARRRTPAAIPPLMNVNRTLT
ncbi:fatty acyl-AMP ligase [Ralstonia pseudosolanacearum]|uniref:AMP-dependent synthetase and ligase n=1 Tax=Ralstonia solanacearum TaxID=305 RepID=A0A0S4TUE8_RALSL|nr:fatty acyl-AMP ligase [Ralstonia pseudosolanacearum]QCX48420.1 fatty acyl-AMP ligase [Ralstonia pseudosolanacearum]CUV13703.1 AMP-dependent synthetase and ligase [Ralstonia solanacearum]